MNSVGWVVVLLCTANFLTSFGDEDSELLRSKDLLISSNKLDLENHGEVMDVTKKAQRGKGASGGGNLVHRRPAKSAARPCFFISSTILAFSLFCLFAFPEE